MSKQSDPDIVAIFNDLTMYVQNERVKAFNEGVDAERKRCMEVAAKRAATWARNPGGHCSRALEEECEDIVAALSVNGFADFDDIKGTQK